MVTRIKILLEPTEYAALVKLSQTELRNPPDQTRHILRLELQRRGLLSDSPTQALMHNDILPRNEVEHAKAT